MSTEGTGTVGTGTVGTGTERTGTERTDVARWRRVEGLWSRALGLSAEERDAFLDDACRGEPDLRSEVESLLLAHVRADGFLAGRAVDQLPDWPEAFERPSDAGRQIGPYRLLEELGSGGMSTVYLASRADAEYEQKVALKIVKRGLDTETVLRRFRSERQILASLTHPNIAKILDGGTTEDGRPYFVMEHFAGTSLDLYCAGLDRAERLGLFRRVCSAVHYAHQNLIVHRDIKPGNVLVTREGVPKLLDFGIAKLLSPEAFPQTVATTRVGLQPMTPQYASPEQLRGEHVTTASDVYSLGMLLHKILTGRRPEEEVPEEDRLSGDLEKIVGMALREEPERRYASAEQLSEDVRLYLEGLPVRAHRDTWRYRAGKFVRRHRVAVVAAALLLAFAAAFIATLAWQVGETRRERARAELERDKSEKVSALLFDLFKSVDPAEARGDTITARELLDRGLAKIETELVGQETVQAAAFDTIGQVYLSLGLYDQARRRLERALDLRQEALDENHPDLADSFLHLGDLLSKTGDIARAEELLRRAVAIRGAIYGADHPEVAEALGYLTIVLWRLGRYDEAGEQQLRALEIQRKHLPEYDLAIAVSLGNLANVRADQGELREAEELTRQALAVRRRIQGEDHPDVLTLMSNLAQSMTTQRRYAAAEPIFRQVLAARRRIFGDEHPDVARALHSLGGLLSVTGELEEADEMLQAALDLRRKLFAGQDTVALATNLSMLASLRRHQGELEDAVALLQESLAVGRRVVPEGHPGLAYGLAELGKMLLEMENFRAAEPVLREAFTIRRRALPATSPLTAESAIALGTGLAALGERAKAERHLLEGHRILSAAGQAGESFRAETLEQGRRQLVALYRAWGREEEARRFEALLDTPLPRSTP